MTDLQRTLDSPLSGARVLFSPTRFAGTLAMTVLIVFVYLNFRSLLPDSLVALAALHAASLFAAAKRGGTAGWQSYLALAVQGATLAWLAVSLIQGLEWPNVEAAFFWTTAVVTLGSAGRHLVRLWVEVRA